jgi:hypothetical protein
VSQRYFITAESTYEDLRISLNTLLAYPNALGKSVFQTALQAPRDSFRRVLLAVDTAIPGYAAIDSAIQALLDSDAMEELDQSTYLAAVASAASGGGGGGASTWDELTGKPSTFTPSAHKASHATGGSDALTAADIGAAGTSHSHAAGDVTSGTFDPARLPLADTVARGGVVVGAGLGVSSGTVSVSYGTQAGTACQGNDARLSDARSPSSHASTHQTGGADAIATTVASPSQITSNQNDYAGATADINRLDANAARNITGLSGGSSGVTRVLVNVGSNAITLTHQDAASEAANRIIVPWASDYILDPSYAAVLVYDATTSRWRII